MKVRRIFKYPTGAVIPKGAIYLGTVTQTKGLLDGKWVTVWFVWHYFSVEIEDEQKSN